MAIWRKAGKLSKRDAGGECIAVVEVKNWRGTIRGNTEIWESLDEREKLITCLSPFSTESKKPREYALMKDLTKLSPWSLQKHKGKDVLRFWIFTFAAFPHPEAHLSDHIIRPRDRDCYGPRTILTSRHEI